MKRQWGGLLIALGVGLGLMAFRKQATPPDLSSPKATVRSFIDALKSGDTASLQQCVKGATNLDVLKQIFGTRFAQEIGTVTNLTAETENDTARVAAEFTRLVPASGQANAKMVPVPTVDVFSLVKQGEIWQLVPDPTFTKSATHLDPDSNAKYLEMRPLSFAVVIVGSPLKATGIEESRAKQQAISCLSNARQIVLGALMYTQDYDEVTPRKGASYVDLVYPYIKSRLVFTCPLDPKGTISYTFNEGLKGVPLSAVKSPAKTVMIYEGKAGKLEYRHEGFALIGFMDGHCKMISPAEAAELIWTVKVPQQAKPVKKKTH